MSQHKLSFGNRTIPEQLIICRRVADGVAQLPAEHRARMPDHAVAARADEAHAACAEVETLKAALKAALHRRNQKVRDARNAAIYAAKGISLATAAEPAAMLAAGLDLVREKQPVGLPDAPKNVRSEPTPFDGRANLRWQRPLRRCSFEVEATTDAAAQTGWKHQLTCFKQSCEVRDLESGKKYWFRIRASNAHGHGAWSQVVSAWVK